MADSQGLIAYLTKYGKLQDESWSNLAVKFGLESAEAARSTWKRYRRTQGKDIIKRERAEYVTNLENKVTEFMVEGSKGEIKALFENEIKTLEELIQKCKIDTSIWKVDRYVQNYWGNGLHPHWQVKAWLSKIDEKDTFQQEFLKFLSSYQPSKISYLSPTLDSESKIGSGCLIINKQDEHINKFDINGKNDITTRWESAFKNIFSIVETAKRSNYINKIVYIIGSDQFNSEWTQATTKGTPQQNILPYQEGFEKICEFEIANIDYLLSSSKYVEIVYVSGNHDEYVGWHLINWLKAFYRNEKRLTFDISPRYRKYVRYGNSAIMFNHGDVMKAEQLAAVFPQEFKDQWSSCKFQYIFTGDKHHEISRDLQGIQWYQLSALSSANSQWDDKRGFSNARRELTAFLIDEIDGLTNIYKRPI